MLWTAVGPEHLRVTRGDTSTLIVYKSAILEAQVRFNTLNRLFVAGRMQVIVMTDHDPLVLFALRSLHTRNAHCRPSRR